MTPLKRKRLGLGLTQAEIADKIGVSAAAYNRWETGSGEPEPKYYLLIAAVMGVTSDEVVEMVVASRGSKPKPAAAGTST